MLLSKLAGEFLQSKRAQCLSVHTLSDYSLTLKRFQNFTGDVQLEAITFQDVAAFLASLDVGKKTVLNHWAGLASMWTYCVKQGIVSENVVHRVTPPRPEQRVIVPFTSSEFFFLVASAKTGNNFLRDYAVLVVLLDTGARASELCSLQFRNYSGNSILVFGKGAKERELPLSDKTLEVINVYIQSRTAGDRDPLFATDEGTSLNRHSLRLMLNRIGKRGGVRKVHAHRFRHTFAITFLRNGGNVYALQKMLGHTTLEMCLRYLAIAQSDIFDAHRIASPFKAFLSVQ